MFTRFPSLSTSPSHFYPKQFRECTSTPVNDTASIDLTCKEPLTEMDPLQLALLSADLKWYIINNQETCNLTACHFQLGGPRDIEVDDADTISFSVLDEDVSSIEEDGGRGSSLSN